MSKKQTAQEAERYNLGVSRLLEKSQISKDDIRYMFAGDLLGQLIATSFGLEKFNIPVFGLFGGILGKMVKNTGRNCRFMRKYDQVR